MGTRTPSHQLGSGLYVSGHPDHHKDRAPVMASRAVPYTGGDVKKSGELGKMFDIPVDPPAQASAPNSGSFSAAAAAATSRPHSGSGPLPRPSNSGSGPQRKSSSGHLPVTGLITSGPVAGAPPRRSSGQLDPPHPFAAAAAAAAVTNLVEKGARLGFRISKLVMAIAMVVFVIGLMAGIFMMVTVKNVVLLAAIGGLLALVLACVGWNYAWGRRGLMKFVSNYPDSELRGAKEGQFIKVTGVVTCGSIPLESSFEKIPRCAYVSTEVHEYGGCRSNTGNPNHHCFSSGLKHSEKYVADFYVSDFQSGLRALVKAGYGAKVASFVKATTKVDISEESKDLSPSFVHWLAGRNLSSDGCKMRLEEGYIKEGSTVSVLGVVRRQDNVLMIVPSEEPISTGCQWCSCLLPTYIEGLIITCDESEDTDVIAV